MQKHGMMSQLSNLEKNSEEFFMHQEEEYLDVEDVRKKIITNSYWT